MDVISKSNLSAICRICCRTKKKLIYISNRVSKEVPYTKIYQECIGAPLKDYTSYPLVICQPCEIDLVNVYEFRKKCIETEEKIGILQEEFLISEISEDPLEREIKAEVEELHDTHDTDFQNDAEEDETPVAPKRYETRGSKNENPPKKKEVKYSCEICKKMYTTRNAVNAHRWHTHQKRPPVMPCKRCGGTFKDREEKNGHECMRKCEHCNKNIRGKHFAMHLLRHTNTEKIHKCKRCPKTYYTPTDLAKHRLTSHVKLATTLCMVCGKMLKQSNLHMHLKTHEPKVEPKRTYPCSECSKVYNSAASLRSHVDSIHLGIQILKYQCPHCEMLFKDHYKRTTHIYKFHLKKPLFTCIHCQKEFYQKSSYSNHIKVNHSFEKLFSCKVCGKSFALDTRRKMHEALHSDARPFTCANCAKSFKMKSHLIRHMRGHTGEKIFTCPHCTNLFYSIRSVRGHVKRDHPNKMMPPPGTILSKMKLEKMAKQQQLEEALLSIPVDPKLHPIAIQVKLQTLQKAPQ